MKKTRLNKRSKKKQREMDIYNPRKEAYFKALAEKQGVDEALCECGCGRPADHWHHVLPLGRGGKQNQDEELMMAVCWKCHRWIHDNHKKAQEKGWILELWEAREKGFDI
jgi:5-methylcytosine-specific restriction endonuclease McrA